MRTIPLIARRAFTYHGRQVQPGELLQATAVEAVSLRYRGQARFAPKAVVPTTPPAVTRRVVAPPTPGPVQPEPPPPVADFPEPLPTEPSSEVAAPIGDVEDNDFSELPKRRRSYKRRDLEAEG